MYEYHSGSPPILGHLWGNADLHEGIQAGQKVQRRLADRVHVRGRPRQGLAGRDRGLGLEGAGQHHGI